MVVLPVTTWMSPLMNAVPPTVTVKLGDAAVEGVTKAETIRISYDALSKIVIDAVLFADNEKNLNPELIVEAIRNNLHIMDSVGTEEYYKIMRECLLTKDLEEFK